MRILAIDPGNERSAWCWLDGARHVQVNTLPNDDVRGYLYDVCAPGMRLAIEMIANYGMPVGREVFDTCVWIGRFAEAWELRGGRVEFVYRKDVKMHLCGSMQAKDANIRASLIDRFGPGKELAIGRKAAPGPLYGVKGDEWSALAVAVTASARAEIEPPQAQQVDVLEPTGT